MRKYWLLVCFINFFIAALMGLFLRLMYIFPLETINYQFLLHGHSHVALLGWVYLALYSLIVHFFIPEKAQEKPVYNRLFWVTEVAVVGMMIRFPIEGYALFSIAFSTLHILCSYYFYRLVLKDARPATLPQRKLLRTALLFMFISTLGVWCLGPAVGILGKASPFYQIAIQFFLHFQFNGWFLFAVLSLFFYQFKAPINERLFLQFYYLLIVATVLTLALPISWYLENPIFYWINSVGVLLQMVSFYFFIKIIQPHLRAYISSLNSIAKTMLAFALTCLAVKITVQLVVLVPELGRVSHHVRDFVIGFIHLTMLGIISGFIFVITLKNNFLNGNKKLVKYGFRFFILGFILTESLLFIQGIYLFLEQGSLPFYYQSLFIVSLMLPLGLMLLISSIFKEISTEKNKN